MFYSFGNTIMYCYLRYQLEETLCFAKLKLDYLEIMINSYMLIVWVGQKVDFFFQGTKFMQAFFFAPFCDKSVKLFMAIYSLPFW